MKASEPKQFLLLNGEPVLTHTLRRFASAIDSLDLVVVLPEAHIITWASLCEKHQFNIPHRTTAGGETRFHSVKNGLALVSEGLVGVHDGVRPMVSIATIQRCFAEAQASGAAIPVIPANESVRSVSGFASKALDRSSIRMVQTPQCFRYAWMKEAFEQEYRETFTDCASVLEAAGFSISLVEGNEENIKITRPIDLVLAEHLIKA